MMDSCLSTAIGIVPSLRRVSLEAQANVDGRTGIKKEVPDLANRRCGAANGHSAKKRRDSSPRPPFSQAFNIELDVPPVNWSKIHVGRFVDSVALLVEPEASQPRRCSFAGDRPTWWPHYDSNQQEACNYAGLKQFSAPFGTAALLPTALQDFSARNGYTSHLRI